jgi:hypothetical protein
MANQATGIGPLAARPLTPQYQEGPQSMSIFSGHPQQTLVARGSRSAVSVNSTSASLGGYPNRIIRGFSFATLPPPSKAVNVVTGVPSRPAPNRGRRTRR